MTILNSLVLAGLKGPTGVYKIEQDYTLNNSTLEIPPNKTLKFNGGTINNGTLQLNNTLLSDMVAGSINAKITGTIQNTVINTSDISGINNLSLTSYNGITVNCDQDEYGVNISIVLNGASNVTFEGNNNTFKYIRNCNYEHGFFEINGSTTNLVIKNFDAENLVLNTALPEYVPDFITMHSAGTESSNIKVLCNTIKSFRVAVSLNNDPETSSTGRVRNCRVIGNTIERAIGSGPGCGYGIHLANVVDSKIYCNNIEDCDRHSIYHAFGYNNKIKWNTIINHHKSNTNPDESAALAVYRHSEKIYIEENTFTDSYNISIHLYGFNRPDGENFGIGDKYNVQKDIHIINNTFNNYTNNKGIARSHTAFIEIGYTGTVRGKIEDVEINGNTFTNSNINSLSGISIIDYKTVQIINNQFSFTRHSADSYDEKLKALIYFGDLPNSSLSNDDYVEIDNNTFNATNNLEGLKVAAIGRGFLLRSNAVLVDTNNQFQNQILSGVKNYSIYDIHNPTIVGGTIINLMSTKRFYLSDAIPDPVDKSAGDVAVMFNKTEQILGRECIISPYNEIAWWKFGQMDMSDDIATTASTPPTQGRYKRNGQYMMVGGRPAFYYGTIWRDGEGNNFSALRTGTSASRPQNVQPGYVYFDSTIGKPIWYKGNGIWVNESGQSV